MLMLKLFVIICTTAIKEVFSVMPFELPMNIEDGNWLIKANLVDRDRSFRIEVQEYIKSINGTVRGRIDFKIDDVMTGKLFYSNASPYKRIFFSKYFICDVYTYNSNGLDYHIAALDHRDFLIHLLLVGPSVVLRMNEYTHVWEEKNDVVVRGTKNHVAKITLDQHLDVWFYFKDDNFETGIKRPNQVLFNGYDSRSRYKSDGAYWFDIYTFTRVEQNFETFVTVPPGLYCDGFLTTSNKPFPKLTQHAIHYISKTKSLNAGPAKKEEVYADEKYQISRIKSSIHGEDNKLITTDTIYDYQLGLEYELTEEGKCLVSPMKRSAPGIVADSSLGYVNYKLDLNQLLNFNLNYRYLGPVLFEERNEIGINAWKVNEQNANFEKNTYKYLVTTQYFNKLTDIISGYTLVGTTIKAYESSTKLSASLTKEYFAYEHEISSSELTRNFNVQNCYPDLKSKKTFAMFFNCEDISCGNFNEFHHIIKDKVKESLVNTGTIAASRITNIVPIFNSNEIIIYITILDFPRLKNAFEMRSMKLDKETLTNLESAVIIDGDEEACLMTNSARYEPFEAIAFCETWNGNLCFRVDGEKVKLDEDLVNGISCSVYMTPLNNIHRYIQELPLDNVLEKLNHISISFVSPNDNKMFTFTPYHVTDVTQSNEEGYQSLYESPMKNIKSIEDGIDTISVIDATDLGSCYRKCAHAVENNCKSFSFCDYDEKVECFVSTATNFLTETSKISHESSCNTYLIGNLQKYKKISSRKFINNHESVQFDSSLERCASLCYNSDLCKSFQFCSGSCSFADHYTDSSSDYSEECDIYIPKVLDRFELTGKFIVKNVFNTELNLDADQCAALCHDWNDDGEICQSFNYCPTKGRNPSLCHLSEYSRNETNGQLIQSDSCQNYQRVKQSMKDERTNKIITKHAQFGTVFEVIMIFSLTGLILGIVLQMAYTKFFASKRNLFVFSNSNTFSWTKQSNYDDVL